MVRHGDSLKLLKAIKNIVYSYNFDTPRSWCRRVAPLLFDVPRKTCDNPGLPRTVSKHGGPCRALRRDTLLRPWHLQGSIYVASADLGIIPSRATTAQRTQVLADAKDRYRYGRLTERLENDYLQGQGNCPETLDAAHNLLTNLKQGPHNMARGITGVCRESPELPITASPMTRQQLL